MDSGVYQQHAQSQAQYVSPVYMQQVYSPQQEFPIYPVVSPTWNPSIVPHFETPLVRTIIQFLFKVKQSLNQLILLH